MDKPLSFNVDHTCLEEGVYISRIDKLSLFKKAISIDIRFVGRKSLLRDGGKLARVPDWFVDAYSKLSKDVLSEEQLYTLFASGIHTIEHALATVCRRFTEFGTLYVGPGGCSTMFYLVIAPKSYKKYVTSDGQSLTAYGYFKVMDAWEKAFALLYNYEVPGLSYTECGNPELHDYGVARFIMMHFYKATKETRYLRFLD